MTSFDSIPEQGEAKRLLAAALSDGPAHAYLFHGPAGVGKRRTAVAFASAARARAAASSRAAALEGSKSGSA